MISQPLTELLKTQVGHELDASHSYLAIAVYFAEKHLDGWCKEFLDQSREEREHALKIMRFLGEMGVPFDIPPVAGAKTEFQAPLETVKKALAQEKTVTGQFNRMAKVAVEQGDFVGLKFLQWFLEEQVEEEAKMSKLIALLDSGLNLFQSEQLLKKE